MLRVLTRRRAALVLSLVLIVVWPAPPQAYLRLTARFGARTVDLKWNTVPVRYFVTDRSVPGVTAAQFRQAMDRAFSTWQSVPTASVTFQFVGFTGARPFDDDDISVLGFLDRPDLERVLGATGFLIDTTTGEIVESDIFFNATFPWSVSSGGESGRFDLESIALHEIGHMVGLGHSMLGETELRPGGRRVTAAEAVMFPIAFSAGNTAERALRADDVAGASDIYPDSRFRQDTGSIRGRVTKNGNGVFGAHVVAFNPETGSLVANFTLNDNGDFTIAGLTPGPHIIRVEPLDDADVESFFQRSVDLDFRVAYHERLAIVPRGGSSSSIEIRVVPK